MSIDIQFRYNIWVDGRSAISTNLTLTSSKVWLIQLVFHSECCGGDQRGAFRARTLNADGLNTTVVVLSFASSVYS